MKRILLIQGDSNRHLGLFRDLELVGGIDIMTYPNHVSFVRKVMTRVSENLSYAVAVREQNIDRVYDRAVIVDTALGRMTRRSVEDVRASVDELRVLLLNSIDASSPSFAPAREKLHWFSKSEIYTFDPVDAKRFGYNYFGLEYYSSHVSPHFLDPSWDCYFVGGLKGGRGSLVCDLFRRFDSAGVAALFECTKQKDKIISDDCPGIYWMESGWQPYECVLEKCGRSNCIVEILQEGQHAQSVRYFEAICMNKKLLTTNERVVELPFYNPDYIKVFRDPTEVDIDWLQNDDMPDYGYDGSFSPSGSRLFQFDY